MVISIPAPRTSSSSIAEPEVNQTCDKPDADGSTDAYTSDSARVYAT